jgi:hypothetical protein
MEVTKSPVFLHHRNAQEALEQERKYRRLSRFSWAGVVLLWSSMFVAAWLESGEYERYASLVAMFLVPLTPISLLAGMLYGGKAVDATSAISAIRSSFFTLARVLSITEEELCARELSEVKRSGNMLILNQAIDIQIFEDLVNDLKVTSRSEYLETRIFDHLADDKAQMKERLNSLHKALKEFNLTAINYNWAFEEARKIRS